MSTFLNRGTEVIPSTQESGGYSFFSLIRAGIARWKSAIMLALLVGGAAAAGTFVAFPAEYSATSLIKFRFNDSLIPGDRNAGAGTKDDLENQQRTQIAFIRSGMVLEEAARSDPKCLPVSRLTAGLKTNFSEGTPVMSISLSGLDPEVISRSVNAVTEVFSQQYAKSERNELLDKSRQLDSAISESLNAILKKKTDMRKLTSGRADDPKVKVAEAALSAASIELTRAELEVEKLEGSIKRLRDRLDKSDTTALDQALLEEAIERLPQIVAAQENITKLETAEADIRLRLSSPDVPQVKQAVDATNRAREALKKLRLDVTPRAETLVRRRVKSELAAIIAKDEEELINTKTTVASLTKRRDTSADSMTTGLPPTIEMQLEGIKQDEEVLRIMRHRREELRIEIQSGGVKVLTFKAEIPTLPNSRPQYIKTALAGIFGFVLGWLLVGIIETHSRRVRDGRVLAAHTGLRILGVIPAGATAGPELLRPQDMALCVAADQLRTSLQLDDRLRSRRTLLVSSATESEGKSTLALLLAGSLARAGFRTLLIDADLRNPSLTTRLGVTLRPGLSESLTLTQWSNGRSRSEEGQEVGEVEEIEGLPLGLIQAGANGQAAATRLARADLRAWFSSLRKNWEYIIVDSPPLLPVPDAAFLGKAADGLVLCARVGVSQVEQVNAALEHVNALGIDCLGIVMNDVRGSRPSYYSSGRVTPEALAAVPVVVGGGNT